MKPFAYLLLIFLLSSCFGDDGYYVKRTDYVSITEVSIPDSALVSDTVQIEATAQENNGCWRDLTFSFDSIADTTYMLSAYGIFESEGICPEVIVTADTTIEFIPTKEGLYQFQIARNSYSSTIDTMIVEENANN
ncbi:MAG: hypothetical protein R6U04_13515 [Bacteroidales bacterium]